MATAAGAPGGEPAAVAHAVPIRIGSDVVGVVAAVQVNGADVVARAADGRRGLARGGGRRGRRDPADGRRPAGRAGRLAARLLRTLLSGTAPDPAMTVADGRRLGVDLGAGAIAVYARAAGDVRASG